MRYFMMNEKAFDTLSIQAKLHIELEEATTDQAKFIRCVRYATEIAQRKFLNNVDEATNTNLKVIMQLIKFYLDSGVHPDFAEDNVPAICHAVTYPELVKLLLTRGANPNFQTNSQSTALHHVAMFFHTFYRENLFTTAELLASAGANLDAKNNRGEKSIELIKNTLLLDKEKINEIEARFKQVTEHPREIGKIATQSIEESPYSSLQLTETDKLKIALYKEKKYSELINSDPTDQIVNSLFQRSQPESKRFLFFNLMATEEAKSQEQKIALNVTQQNIIEGILKFIFDDISSSLTPSQAIKALNAILPKELAENEIEALKKIDLWDSIKQIRDILAHPYPQNRYQGDASAYKHGVLKGRDPVTSEEVSACETGVYDSTVYYYKSGFGSKILTEPQGILGLTARNDFTARWVTKESVVNYIHELIQNEIKQHQNKAAAIIQLRV